jgi:glyoxylase-like metal-dependent hydrolase (beta-lactamase superfamily II)
MSETAFRGWTIGDVRVTRVQEMSVPFDPTMLFVDVTPARVLSHDWLRPHFAFDDGNLHLSIHAFVVEAGGKRIVVDTCVGNDKERPETPFHHLATRFFEDLSAAGFPPESIDYVLCTHMHVDHVGWNTRLVNGKWVPSFPNARYLFARTEWEHWSKEAESEADGGLHASAVIGDSVRPIFDAGLAQLVEATHQVTPEVRLEPTPGHTPGHVSVRIASRGAEAVITGDMIHHPIQCAEPEICTHFCTDAERARATRRSFLARHAGAPVLVLGTHFAGPTGGHIAQDGETWRFVPAT